MRPAKAGCRSCRPSSTKARIWSQRFYVSEGFVEAVVEPPTYTYLQPDLVRTQIVIHEGQKYFFGNVNFVGPTIYGGEALRGQILDLLRQPYTEARLADISAAAPGLL